MFRDRIVTGCTSVKWYEKLINEGDKLTMDKAIQVVQNFEYCQKQLSTMTLSGATGTSVDVMHDATHRRSTGGAQLKTPWTSNANSAGRFRYQQPKSQQAKCGNCGTYHKKNDCPVFGKVRHYFGKQNHFKKLCRSRPVHDIDDQSECNNVYTGVHYSDIIQEYFIDTVSTFSSVSLSQDCAFAQLHVGPQNTQINFKTDTGSAKNTLPHSLFKSLNISHPIEPPTHKLTSYTGSMIPVVGMIRLAYSHKSREIQTLFYIVEGNVPPLLSLQSSVDLGLIKLTYDVERSFRVPPVSLIDKHLIEHE